MCTRPDHDRQSSGWLKSNCNFLLWWPRVRTKAVWRPDGCIWIAIPALWRRASERDTTSSGRLIDLPFIGTWKESETVRVQRGVRTGCLDIWTDASWTEPSRHSGWSGRKCTSSERMMLGLSGVQTVWHVVRTDETVTDGRPDGMTHHPDGWQGTENLLTLKYFWIVESLWSIFYKQVFLSKHRMRPKTNRAEFGILKLCSAPILTYLLLKCMEFLLMICACQVSAVGLSMMIDIGPLATCLVS